MLSIKFMMKPEELKDFLDRLMSHVFRLGTKFGIYEYLGECLRDKREIAIDFAPIFFDHVRESLASDIILSLDKLYAGNKKAKRSLVHYLRQVKMHSAHLTRKNKLISLPDIEQQLRDIENFRNVLSNIKKHRNKYYAHHDEAYFDNPSKLHNDAPLYISELSELVKTTQNILKVHYEAMNNTMLHSMMPIRSDDVSNLIGILRTYDKWSKDQEIIEVIINREDLRELD